MRKTYALWKSYHGTATFGLMATGDVDPAVIKPGVRCGRRVPGF